MRLQKQTYLTSKPELSLSMLKRKINFKRYTGAITQKALDAIFAISKVSLSSLDVVAPITPIKKVHPLHYPTHFLALVNHQVWALLLTHRAGGLSRVQQSMRAIYIVSAGTEWDNSPVLLLEPLGACHKTQAPGRIRPGDATPIMPLGHCHTMQ